VHVHTPIGDAAEELTRIAAEVGADMVVVEAHEHGASKPRRVFHRSMLARITTTAPCTVLTIRRPPPDPAEPLVADPDPFTAEMESVIYIPEGILVEEGHHA
jgi:hypothetical protein